MKKMDGLMNVLPLKCSPTLSALLTGKNWINVSLEAQEMTVEVCFGNSFSALDWGL